MMMADAPARALYSGLEGEKNPLRRLEEFLVGTGARKASTSAATGRDESWLTRRGR